MSRTNKTGRSRGGGRFVQLHHFMMQTAAWRSLQPQDRAIYLEIAALYDGANNGRLALGVRAAADRANVNKDTAAKCFARLLDRGFIECAQAGRFSQNARQATEWRLTQFKCDRSGDLPSKAFMKWTPETAKHSPLISDTRSPRFGQSTAEKVISVPPFRTEEAA